MNNPRQPTAAAAAVDDKFLKRMMKKTDAFTLGLFFFSLKLLYDLLYLNSSDLVAIALGLTLIVLITTVFLYLNSCFTDDPEFPKVQVTVLVFCAGLLVLAIFLTRHT